MVVVHVAPVGGPSFVAARVVIGVFAVGLIADRLVGGATPWRAARTDRGTFWLIQGGQLIALYLGLELPRWASSGRLARPLWPVGVVVMVAGIGLRVWSVHTLGASFHRDVRVEAGQTLVTSGPYRWVRHPSYTAVLLMFAGLGVAQADAYSIIVLAVLPTLVYLRRIAVEEAALDAAFGASYRAFAADRKRLVPGVY